MINRFPDKINHRFEKNFIIEATEIVLNNKIFVFNNTHYEKINGTAMGTNMAPKYAILTLEFLEGNFYDKIGTYFCSKWLKTLRTRGRDTWTTASLSRIKKSLI